MKMSSVMFLGLKRWQAFYFYCLYRVLTMTKAELHTQTCSKPQTGEKASPVFSICKQTKTGCAPSKDLFMRHFSRVHRGILL